MAKDKPPRISVNKLAEYIMAKGGRQRQILKDQKFPTEFKGPFYKEASEAVSQAIASNLENLLPLTNAVSVLSQSTTDKIGTQRRISANIDAIETFLHMLDQIDLKGALPKLGAHSSAPITIHGVEISVRPEIILTGTGKSKSPLVGGVKLHFSRTFSLTQESSGYVSAILQEWCKQNKYAEGQSYGPYCSVIDVGSKSMFQGVKSTVAKMRDVEAACQNIFSIWPGISP